MKRIRGGRGLGDSIYLRPIVEHFARAGEAVIVHSDYPDVFIESGATVGPFRRGGDINVLAHYVGGKTRTDTNQWQDVCAGAKLPELPLRFDWTVRNTALVDRLRANAGGDPIIVVHGGRAPMNRSDGYGMELMPDKCAFDTALAVLAGCYTVGIGNAQQLYPLHVDIDLNGSTSVSDLLDIGAICDGVVAQCSFCVPLAESFDKPLLAIWAARGVADGVHPYLKAITPKKILSKPTSRYVMDDWSVQRIQDVASTMPRYPMAVAA